MDGFHPREICVSLISDAAAQAHQVLAPLALEFVRFQQHQPVPHPVLNVSNATVPSFLESLIYPISPWPCMVGETMLAEIKSATLGLDRLLKALPKRLFGNNPVRLREAFKVPAEFPLDWAMMEPDGIDYAIARLDFIQTTDGLKCLEFNPSSYTGGWQIQPLAPFLLQTPLVAEFCRKHHLTLHSRDTVTQLFKHILQTSEEANLCGDGICNILIPADFNADAFSAFLFFNHALANAQESLSLKRLEGRVILAGYGPDFHTRANRIYWNETPIHAVLEVSKIERPAFINRAFRMGHLVIFNSPANQIFDKSVLAILSEHQDDPVFDKHEQTLIRKHIPWSRVVIKGTTSWNNQPFRMPQDLMKHKDIMVLKRVDGYGGQGVVVGKFCSHEDWAACVSEALQNHQWLVQEYCASSPYLFPDANGAISEHDVVWGFFAFGDHYGGGFLRQVPKYQHCGVINAAQGAHESLLFEIDDKAVE